MSKYKLAIIAVLLAATFWGLVPSVTKLSLEVIPPLNIQFLRFTIASIFVLPFFMRAKKNLRGNILKLFFFSLLPFLNVTFFILGVRWTKAMVTPVLYAAVPLLVAFFSWLLFKEKISLIKIIGILLGFFGVLIIVILPILGGGSGVGDVKGNAFILLAVFSFVFYTIFSKSILKEHSPIVISSLGFFLTAFLSFPLSIVELINNSSWMNSLSIQTLLGVFYLGSLGTLGSYFLYQWGVKHSSPLEASLTFYFQPIVGSLAAVFLLQEKLTFLFIVGSLIALSGVFLTTSLSYLKNKKL